MGVRSNRSLFLDSLSGSRFGAPLPATLLKALVAAPRVRKPVLVPS
ncbi:Uncharacterised protein [Mycobacteroides abscessus subsp. abscessus]|nr:Uncharacterised protein [Mycobacteroides abscessus subsp. abscessus]